MTTSPSLSQLYGPIGNRPQSAPPTRPWFPKEFRGKKRMDVWPSSRSNGANSETLRVEHDDAI
jgi:hypothetical protein